MAARQAMQEDERALLESYRYMFLISIIACIQMAAQTDLDQHDKYESECSIIDVVRTGCKLRIRHYRFVQEAVSRTSQPAAAGFFVSIRCDDRISDGRERNLW